MTDAKDQTGSLPTEELEREITSLAGQIAAATCRWLLLIAEYDRRGAYEGWGVISMVHWLQLRCGMDARSAREKVRVARALEPLPHITVRFGEGRLSYSRVRALTRFATPATDADLADLAEHATAAHIERIASGYAAATHDAAQIESRRCLTWRDNGDGTVTMTATLSAEEAAVVRASIETAQETAREPEAQGGSAEPPAPLIPAIDAFVSVVSESDRVAPIRPKIVVHVEEDDLATLRDGTGIRAAAARMLSCDATIQPVLERDGQPVAVGRKHRCVPPRLREALEARDRTCVAPACNNRRFLHAHHVLHWADDGPSILENTALLCGTHHRALHRGLFHIEMKDGRPVVIHPEHGVIGPVPLPGSAEPHLAPTVSTEAVIPKWDGGRLDLDLAVTGLLQTEHLAAAAS